MVRRYLGDGGSTVSKTLDSQARRNAAEDMAGPHASNSTATGDRPPLVPQQSNSLPSTPYLRSRNGSSAHTKSPSLGRNALNISPRTANHDPRQNPVPRRAGAGCKYEAGMARARRRVPYSLGPDKLGAEEERSKTHLNPAEDDKLSGDMRELYDRLLPSKESVDRRRHFVVKLENLLKDRWPEHRIAVNVFGSTGNDLGTTDSDVDICITTDWKELEHVCSLAELLARNGMERVVCVSSAKVPIVKVWDPELELACDMNVNNPIALENTELIRAYVDLDKRVRPLAMLIKHWAKRRILNDAALGGTLSSYTWICMILNFLQTRKVPILPCLQQQPGLKPKIIDGINVAFEHNIEAFRNFGSRNKDSLASLMLQFFKYYGHELDFEDSVMSVRLGKILTKTEKGWHRLQDNRLCVEEPFNTTRNLGNTADDTSMRGIHIELRRAFKKLSEGDLESWCEQYEAPQDEGRTSEIFIKAQAPRPVVPQAPSQGPKSSRNSMKRNANNNNSNNINNNNNNNRAPNGSVRRPSNPQRTGYLRNLPFQMTPQELAQQQQHQQHILHDQLFQQYQYLQAQEQELRMQLHHQALVQGRLTSTNTYPHIAFPSYTTSENGFDENSHLSTNTASQSAMSAPLRQQHFVYGSPYLSTALPNYGVITNPSSPLLATAMPDTRRYSRRTSMTPSSSSASMRAHSQPARPLPGSLLYRQPVQVGQESAATDNGYHNARRPSASSSVQESSLGFPPNQRPSLPYRKDSARQPVDFLAYYVGQTPPIPGYSRSAGISPVPSQVGLAIQNGGLSPRYFPRMPSYPSTTAASPPSQPISDTGDEADMLKQDGLSSPTGPNLTAKRRYSGPLVLDASNDRDVDEVDTEAQVSEAPITFSASTSEDLACDTPSSSDDLSQDLPERFGRDTTFPLTHFQDAVAIQELSAVGITRTKANDASFEDHDDQDREITPTGSISTFESGDLKNNFDSNKSGLTASNGLANGKSAGRKIRDQLSPVKEVPTPPQLPKPTNVNSRARKSSQSPAISGMQKLASGLDALAVRPNGAAASSPAVSGSTNPSSGWQTQRKKKKPQKATLPASETTQTNSTTSGENLKKGG